MTAPILTFYFFSRRFEYAADKISVEFTRDGKAAIRALENLYSFTQAPTRCNRIAELFMTHPSLVHRVAALGGGGRMPEGPVKHTDSDVPKADSSQAIGIE